MKIKQTTYEDGKEHWQKYIDTHPDVKMKDIYIVYTYHYENVITKEFASYDEIDEEWGGDWELSRIDAGNRTKRQTPYFNTKHRIVSLFPVKTVTNLEKLLKTKETRDDVAYYIDIEEWEDEYKDLGYNSMIFEWVTRSW